MEEISWVIYNDVWGKVFAPDIITDYKKDGRLNGYQTYII